MSAREQEGLESRFYQRFDTDEELVTQLLSCKLRPGELAVLKKLAKAREIGLTKALTRLKSAASRTELESHVETFCSFGPAGLLSVGAQRGGDFLQNQLRGQWAEQVCCSIDWPDHVILPFGPSGAAMPGEDDHGKIVRAFREITLLEGKRPDLVGFSSSGWALVESTTREAAADWPARRLIASEYATLRACRCGIEVKNSAWHYRNRRAAGGGPLAVTVKDEELSDLSDWSHRIGVPILFMQVLFDSVYCMSFARMQDAIRRGYLYQPGDYIAETDRKSQKHYHRFFLEDDKHLRASTRFPDQSVAVVEQLPNGSIIPYIRFAPAEAYDAKPSVLEREVSYTPES